MISRIRRDVALVPFPPFPSCPLIPPWPEVVEAETLPNLRFTCLREALPLPPVLCWAVPAVLLPPTVTTSRFSVEVAERACLSLPRVRKFPTFPLLPPIPTMVGSSILPLSIPFPVEEAAASPFRLLPSIPLPEVEIPFRLRQTLA